MSTIQTYIGSAYSSYPIRWIETPESARSGYAHEKNAEKPIEKIADADLGKPRSESGDVLDISSATQKALESSRSESKNRSEGALADSTKPAKSEKSEQSEKTDQVAAESTDKSPAEQSSASKSPTGTELTPEEQQQVSELKARDLEVRVHEMAHLLAGGAFVTSGPSYEYQVGPDGQGYAVGGSVGIDTSPIAGDPEATIAKMQTVAAAALAPAKPSGQDQKVAAAARQAEAQARAELVKQKSVQPSEESSEDAQSTEKDAPVFSVARSADRTAEFAPKAKAEDSVMSSLVHTQPKSGAGSTPGSAYKAQSVMSLATPRFSAFA